MTNARNGCVPANVDIKPGMIVQVMPRQAALIVSRKHGEKAPSYTGTASDELRECGYQAKVQRVDSDVLIVKPLGCMQHAISKSAIFGIAHAPLDVVEVGLQSAPDRPPMRRCFIGYSFDSEFSPVVLTYDEDDTTSILEDANSACVDLECAEIWQFCYPARDQSKPKDQVSVTVSVNGKQVPPCALSAETWANLRG